MKLENWWLEWMAGSNWIDLPELRMPCLHGNVYGSDHFPDGTWIRTATLKGKRGENIVTTSGHEYELGAINLDIEFPETRANLMRKLPELTSPAPVALKGQK